MASHYIDELVEKRQEELKEGYTIDVYDGETGHKIGSEHRPGTEQPAEEPTAPTWEPVDYAWGVLLALAVAVLIWSIVKLSRQLKH